MGHSVGAYVLMEVIRELREKGEKVKVVGGVGLFPTIVDIGKSSGGRVLTVSNTARAARGIDTSIILLLLPSPVTAVLKPNAPPPPS